MGSVETRPPLEPMRLRFGLYELDTRSGELHRSGVVVHLPRQPFTVLALLAGRAGGLVTRDEIRELLWGDSTFVDFDGSLNFCINQIRRALQDSADSPRYVHTLPRRGYRFIAPVDVLPVENPEPGNDTAVDGRTLDTAVARRPALGTRGRRSLLSTVGPRTLALAASLALVAVVAALVTVGRRPERPAEPVFQRVTSRRGGVTAARFAPDGDVVYSAGWEGRAPELFRARPGLLDGQSLGVRPASVVGVLPAGDVAAIVYRDDRPNVLVRLSGASAPREVRDFVHEADWSREDAAAIALRQGPFDHLEFPVGHEVDATQAMIRDLRVSPDGREVAFIENPVMEDDRGDVVAVDRAGRRRVLTAGWASLDGLAWSPEGREVWFTGARAGDDSTLNAVDLSGRERVLLRGPGRLVLHDAAPDGRLLLERAIRYVDARVRLRGERTDIDLTWQNPSLVTGLAEDGSAIVVTGTRPGGNPGHDVFYRTTDGAPAVRLGEGLGMDVSPDGRWVLSIPTSGPPRILALPTHAGSPLVLGAGLTGHAAAAWFPDSRRVAFVAAEEGRAPRLFVQDLDGATARAVGPEAIGGSRPAVSIDASVVVVRTAGAEGTWTAVPVAGGPAIPVAGVDRKLDKVIRWTADGRALLVQRGNIGSTCVDRVEVPSGARRQLTSVEPPDPTGLFRIGTLLMTPDTRTLAYTVERVFSELYVVTGVR